MEWAVSWFLVIRGRNEEGLTLFQNALNLDEDRALHGRVMARCAGFCYEMGRLREGEERSRQSLAIAREAGDPGELALALRRQGMMIATIYCDFEQAHPMVDESLALWRALGDAWGMAFSLQGEGVLAYMEGDILSALSFAQESLEQARAIGDRHRIGAELLNIGATYGSWGEHRQALQYTEESLAIWRELGGGPGAALALSNMGSAAVALGDYAAALRYLEQALDLAHELGLLPLAASTLQEIASVLSLTDRHDEADERMAECRLVLQSVENKEENWRLPDVQAQLAYRRGDLPEALRLAREALDYAQANHLPVEEEVSWTLMGLAEIRLGHLDAAWRHMLSGLPHSMVKWHVMRGIYGLAALEASGGKPERAVELAALVQYHRATEYEFKVYADQLLAELQAVLPADVYAAAVERGQALDLDAVVAELLAESEP